jgi:hypothetical protein
VPDPREIPGSIGRQRERGKLWARVFIVLGGKGDKAE